MNGANPFVGAENLAHNIDHFYIVTEYSLGQLLELGGFRDIRPFALKLYVFWKNPLNYVGLAVTSVLELVCASCSVMYGKKVSVLSKKVAAVRDARLKRSIVVANDRLGALRSRRGAPRCWRQQSHIERFLVFLEQVVAQLHVDRALRLPIREFDRSRCARGEVDSRVGGAAHSSPLTRAALNGASA